MTANLSKVHSPYGAPMGRSETHTVSPSTSKTRMERIRINSQGYDAGGAYWGNGQPLFHAWAEDKDGLVFELWFRASDRDEAKAVVIAQYPGVTFYR